MHLLRRQLELNLDFDDGRGRRLIDTEDRKLSLRPDASATTVLDGTVVALGSMGPYIGRNLAAILVRWHSACTAWSMRSQISWLQATFSLPLFILVSFQSIPCGIDSVDKTTDTVSLSLG